MDLRARRTSSGLLYGILASVYLNLNRFDDAAKLIQQANEHKVDAEGLHSVAYQLAFLNGDAAEMSRQVDWARGKPGQEDHLLSQQSDTEAYYGKFGRARNVMRQAIESATQNDSTEAAAVWHLNAALREAEFGNQAMAKQEVRAALALASDRDIKLLAALVFARTGQNARVQPIVGELGKNHPSNTYFKFYWLPAIKAALELGAGNSARALMLLETVAPYELGTVEPEQSWTMYPVYLRGQAQLSTHNGSGATVEFQKFLDHRGVAGNSPLAALALLGLARAKALQATPLQSEDADAARVRALTLYKSFLTLWKDADPDIPILRQAKAEYAKLQ